MATAKKTSKKKLKVDECEAILFYLAKHEKNERVIQFLDDREVAWREN